MPDPIESYKLGNIQVHVKKTDRPNRLQVECNDGEFRSEFMITPYEFQNYRRLMNLRITEAYAKNREDE